MSKFKNKVINIIKEIPKGEVASYGQVALYAGIPRAARQVGWILANLEIDKLESLYDLPWWRVINNAGRISIKGSKHHDAVTQKKLMEKEGIVVSKDLTFDIEKYRWRPSPEKIKSFELDEKYIFTALEKYSL